MIESEFLEAIERVNQDLAQAGVPIHARAFAAFRVIARGYEGPVLGAGVDPEAYPPFVGPNLFQRVCDWYDARFASRMNIPSDRGMVPVMIRDDVYLIRIPLVFGQPRVSILPLVQGLTERLAASLSPEEQGAIKKAFEDGFALTYEIEDLRTSIDEGGHAVSREPTRLMLENAVGDRDRAVRCLTGGLPDTNGACFNTQQHAEKMLKAFLLAKGAYPADQLRQKYRHDLSRLVSECCTIYQGFSTITADVNELAKVTMDIRYTQPREPLSRAIALIWAGLRVGGLAACAISDQPRRYRGCIGS